MRRRSGAGGPSPPPGRAHAAAATGRGRQLPSQSLLAGTSAPFPRLEEHHLLQPPHLLRPVGGLLYIQQAVGEALLGYGSEMRWNSTLSYTAGENPSVPFGLAASPTVISSANAIATATAATFTNATVTAIAIITATAIAIATATATIAITVTVTAFTIVTVTSIFFSEGLIR